MAEEKRSRRFGDSFARIDGKAKTGAESLTQRRQWDWRRIPLAVVAIGLAALLIAPAGVVNAQRPRTPNPTATSTSTATPGQAAVVADETTVTVPAESIVPAPVEATIVQTTTTTETAAEPLDEAVVSQPGRFHIVQQDETLFGIALFSGLTLDEIVNANPMINPDNILPGQRIFMPASVSAPAALAPVDAVLDNAVAMVHIVQPFETLFEIAIMNGLTLDEIIAANPELNPEALWVGQEVTVPFAAGDALAATESPTTPAAAVTEPVETVAAPEASQPSAVEPASPSAAQVPAETPAAGPEENAPTDTPMPTPSFTPSPSPTPAPTLTPTPAPTLAPTPTAAAVQLVAAPSTESDGSYAFCSANSMTSRLDLPGPPIQVLVQYDIVYMLADGDLWGVHLDAIAADGQLSPVNLMPVGRQVGRYTINEFVYATIDSVNGDLLLLDKSTDIYRYTAAGIWQIEYAATQVPDQYPDPQFLAIRGGGGVVYALDADLTRIWRIGPDSQVPETLFYAGSLLNAVDMVLLGGDETPSEMLALKWDSGVERYVNGAPVGTLRYFSPTSSDPWPAALILIEDGVAVIDAQERSIVAFEPDSGKEQWRALFRFEQMPRLRSAAIAGDRVLGVAGMTLYSASLRNTGAECPPVSYDDAYAFRGADVQAIMAGYQLPFADGWLPVRPRSFPGARRLYRHGVHVGIDFYRTDAPEASYNDGVLPVADGTVIRSDTDYAEMTPVVYRALIDQTDEEHRTLPSIRDKLLGRQVHIIHANGVVSKYGHLDSITPGIEPGVMPNIETILGLAGVSGTSSGVYGYRDGEHLHMELWVNGKYFGYGLNLYETMRLWQAVFEPGSSRFAAALVATPAPLVGEDVEVTAPLTPEPTPTFMPSIERTATATPEASVQSETVTP